MSKLPQIRANYKTYLSATHKNMKLKLVAYNNNILMGKQKLFGNLIVLMFLIKKKNILSTLNSNILVINKIAFTCFLSFISRREVFYDFQTLKFSCRHKSIKIL